MLANGVKQRQGGVAPAPCRWIHGLKARATLWAALLTVLPASSGCYSIRNAWLDPTVLGNFRETAATEIRTSLTLEDTPLGIPGAVFPSPQDLIVRPVEYPISPGDALAVEIYELRQPQVPFQAQAVVSSTGYVNLPVVGRVYADGVTVPEFEEALVDALREQNVLINPEVTVNPVFLQNATYSIFGIGVSAATNAPLRAGTFPIRRPGLRILEAINQVGGLNEFVTDVYVFRYDKAPWLDRHRSPSGGESTSSQEPATWPIPTEFGDPGAPEQGETTPERAGDDNQALALSPEEELIAVVIWTDEEIKPPRGKSPSRYVPESLEPDPTQPYIWVDNEFIENPAYRPLSSKTAPPPPAPLEMGVPAVQWDRIAGDTSYRIIRIPADLLRYGDPEVNIVVRAGDVIRIVSGEIGVYYVMGQVSRVGAFPFNAEKITLKAAIAAAGGLSSLAWPDRCTVYRRIGQREQMIQVNLDRIFAGRDSDFYVKRGDIINVGTHPFAPFLQTLRGLTVPNPVFNVGYSFTYARNFADIDSFAAQRNPQNETDRFPALFP